mmetsp:Transcript_61092/g.132416  ORF Transcript_61092/g.132416 Transcript_61092/m.132416 type:complete len:723 (-) Transcript_61092:39-2207(-)
MAGGMNGATNPQQPCGREVIQGRLKWAPGMAGTAGWVFGEAWKPLQASDLIGSMDKLYKVQHYAPQCVGRAFGPIGLDKTLEFCHVLTKKLSAAAVIAGGEEGSGVTGYALTTPAEDLPTRTNVAAMLGSFLAVRHRWSANKIRSVLGAEDAQLTFSCSWSSMRKPETSRHHTVYDCWLGIEMAVRLEWINPAEVYHPVGIKRACKLYKKLALCYDASWIVPGQIMVCADPGTTVADRNPSTFQRIFTDDASESLFASEKSTSSRTGSATPGSHHIMSWSSELDRSSSQATDETQPGFPGSPEESTGSAVKPTTGADPSPTPPSTVPNLLYPTPDSEGVEGMLRSAGLLIEQRAAQSGLEGTPTTAPLENCSQDHISSDDNTPSKASPSKHVVSLDDLIERIRATNSGPTDFSGVSEESRRGLMAGGVSDHGRSTSSCSSQDAMELSGKSMKLAKVMQQAPLAQRRRHLERFIADEGQKTQKLAMERFNTNLTTDVNTYPGWGARGEKKGARISERPVESPGKMSLASADTVCKTYAESPEGDMVEMIDELPTDFASFLRENHVVVMVRCNFSDEPGMPAGGSYNSEGIAAIGIQHADIRVPDYDGGLPTTGGLRNALVLAQEAFHNPTDEGAVLVHCKGGFGRSVVLACLLVIHQFDVPGAGLLGWVRMCRPGAITTPIQEVFLKKMTGRAAVLKWANLSEDGQDFVDSEEASCKQGCSVM